MKKQALSLTFAVLIFTFAASAQNWTGSGGRGTSITILAPQATGLAKDQSYLPALVQGEFVSNFSGYSAISVLDRERLDEQYLELLSGIYDDKAAARMDLGQLAPTTHLMFGKITKTATGYALQMQITNTADKTTVASYSGTFSFWELDNLTGIRRASLDLLQKMGVTLTAKARGELSGAAAANHVSAQTALARGVTAQRQGTEVEALSYFFQATAFDPSMLEAANRSSMLRANILSGNMGDDIRNDIAWRKQWVERLTETERFFDNFNQRGYTPYILFYTNDIKHGAINYQNETVTMSIETYLYGNVLSIERALQTIWDGLNATGRKEIWDLGGWPKRSVTALNAFTRRNHDFSVAFELLNNQNKVIGRQTLQLEGSWGLNSGGRPGIETSAPDWKTLYFYNVDANDITDRMMIRVASVNGADAEAAAIGGTLQIQATTTDEIVRRAEAEQKKEQRRIRAEERIKNKEQLVRFGVRIPFSLVIRTTAPPLDWEPFGESYAHYIGITETRLNEASPELGLGLTLRIRVTDLIALAAEFNYSAYLFSPCANESRGEFCNDNEFIKINMSDQTLNVPLLLRLGKNKGFYLESGFQWGFPISSTVKIKAGSAFPYGSFNDRYSNFRAEEDYAIILGVGRRRVDSNTHAARSFGLRLTYYLTKWDKYGTLNAPFIAGVYFNGEW